MSDHDALLAAILDSPQDDAPRLVMADWLEEHGDAGRADFIRVQCSLSRLTPEAEGWSELALRERDLWAQHGDAWKSPLPRWARPKVVFRRGFPAGLETTLTQWLKQSSSLRKKAPIEALQLQWDAARLPALAQSPTLAGIHTLAAWWFDEPELRVLLASPHLGRLRALLLGRGCMRHGTNRDEVARALAGSEALRGLTALDLHWNEIGPAGCEALADSPHLANLTALDLDTNHIGDHGLLALARSRHLTRLTHLDLGTNDVTDSGVEALAASSLRLEYLNLWSRRVGPRSAEALAAAPTMAGLRTLVLHFGQIGPAGVRALAASPHLANLTGLYLYLNAVGDEGAKALAESPYLTNLRYLDLSGNDITEAGARVLGSAPNLSHLVRLTLDCAQLSVATLRELQSSPRLPRLRELRAYPIVPNSLLRREADARFSGLTGDAH